MSTRVYGTQLRVFTALLMCMVPGFAYANDWVIGPVAIVEDYRGFDARFGILVTLTSKSYYSGGASLSICTERFRIVVGQENVTAETQKNFFATLLAARAAGDKVRLFVNPSNAIDGYCAVQIVSIGDV
jgi:hypothetical protein